MTPEDRGLNVVVHNEDLHTELWQELKVEVQLRVPQACVLEDECEGEDEALKEEPAESDQLRYHETRNGPQALKVLLKATTTLTLLKGFYGLKLKAPASINNAC